MGDRLLEVDHLRRRFGERVAVDGVSFEIGTGETYGLLGPNGAGKTTTISMIAGVLASHGGSVHIDGAEITTRSGPAKSALGLVPQEIALFDELSAVENLRFFGRLQGMTGPDLDARIGEVLEIVGLGDRRDDRIEEYSGGMKRRANIAAGLLHHPKLLILDEPTAGVDPQSRNQILASIEELGGAGLSVLYTTHYMEEAERLCDRVGVIDHGRLIAQGSQRELINQIGARDVVELEIAAVDGGAVAAAVAAVEGTGEVQTTRSRVIAEVDDAGGVLAAIVAAAADTGATVRSVEVKRPDLETVFLTLTGRALRDDASGDR